MLLVVLIVASSSTSALGDPPITPPSDPSVVPVLPSDFTSPAPALHALQQGALVQIKGKIHLYQKSAWRWQSLMGLGHTPASRLATRTKSLAYANWALKTWKARSKRLHAQARQWMKRRISYFKQTVEHWTLVLGTNPLEKLDLPRRELASAGNTEAQFNRWQRNANAVLAEVENPPFLAQFDCIHRYEGAWNSNTGNGYYGGLQMDLAFQRLYGAYLLRTKGTADNWTKAEQVNIALKAYFSGRGFHPWPNTAHSCGLI